MFCDGLEMAWIFCEVSVESPVLSCPKPSSLALLRSPLLSLVDVLQEVDGVLVWFSLFSVVCLLSSKLDSEAKCTLCIAVLHLRGNISCFMVE